MSHLHDTLHQFRLLKRLQTLEVEGVGLRMRLGRIEEERRTLLATCRHVWCDGQAATVRDDCVICGAPPPEEA